MPGEVTGPASRPWALSSGQEAAIRPRTTRVVPCGIDGRPFDRDVVPEDADRAGSLRRYGVGSELIRNSHPLSRPQCKAALSTRSERT